MPVKPFAATPEYHDAQGNAWEMLESSGTPGGATIALFAKLLTPLPTAEAVKMDP